MAPELKRLETVRDIPSLALAAELADGPVYLVGGPVRDILLGRPLHDLDLAVPEPDLEPFSRALAARLGVPAVPLGRDKGRIFRLPTDTQLDIAPLWGETIEADLARRDLTINAMALPLSTNGPMELVDPFGGRADLEAARIRFVSEANVIGDPLRMLRLFRLAAQLNFQPDPDSLALVTRHAPKIQSIPGERIHDELLAFLSEPRIHPLVVLMHRQGLLTTLFPELDPLDGCGQSDMHHLDVLGHTLLALDRLEALIAAPETALPERAPDIRDHLAGPKTAALIKMAILFHDLGKPEARTETNGRVQFIGHETAGVRLFGPVAQRLRLSVDEENRVGSIIRMHMTLFQLEESWRSDQLTPKGMYRFGRNAGDLLWSLLLHALADLDASQGPKRRDRTREGFLTFLHHLLGELDRQKKNTAAAPRLLNGRDLMTELDIGPSPVVGELLDAVDEARATGRVTTRDEALSLAWKELRRRSGRG
jgi:tRNA nucleotidyltransferase/poly(A) polymerase